MTDIPAPKDSRSYCGFHGGPHKHIHRSSIGGEPPVICVQCAVDIVEKFRALGVVGFEDISPGKTLPALAVYKGT